MDIPQRPDPAPSRSPDTQDDDDRDGKVRRAVLTWQGQLVDLGGRNTLLYYRDLRLGTLDLSPGSSVNHVAVAELLSSRSVRLSTLFADQEVLAGAAKRARTVRAKAKEMFEERGLRTLFLAWGMATWNSDRSSALPAAPVLLRSALITPRGSAGDDFDLVLTDEYEVNPTLLHLLSVDYEVSLEPDDLLDLLDHSDSFEPDPTALFDHLVKAAAGVPGFRVEPRVVVGNFSYAKLPMVKDLESALEAISAHDLLAAIAGSTAARDSVRERHADVSPEEPNHVPLADEFLVLDADASQNYAINAVLAGSDLVIDGPPGTGKSQTIANLIASLVARGKKVLFVAEKRAAIDAVMSRINKVGLGDLVLDLHDGVGNRKLLAQQLARALVTASQLPLPDTSALRPQERRREKLVEHDLVMHRTRDPWDVSVFDIQSALLGIAAEARTNVRLHGQSIVALDAETRLRVRETLEDLLALDGPALIAGVRVSPWRPALFAGSIGTGETAAEALALCARMAERDIPHAVRTLNDAAESLGLEPRGSLTRWGDVLDLWEEVRETSTVFMDGIWSEDLGSLATTLQPAGKGATARAAALLFNGTYRRARKHVRSFVTIRNEMTSKRLLGSVEAASEQQVRWTEYRTKNSPPAYPVELDALLALHEQTIRSLAHLSELCALDDLGGVAVGDLLDSIEALLQQRQVALRLPELSRLRAELARASLDELVNDLGSRALDTNLALAAFDHCWFSSILDVVSASDPLISGVDADNLSAIERDFQRGDQDHLTSTPRRVLRAWAERAVQARNDFADEATVVTTQARLKRKHLPPRDLFQAAPNVLLAMKPCWAMSPLVVSHVLPPEPLFDVVIFDEASQILPADAIGSLLRGKQAVVAGDEKQLPPTTFFLSQTNDGDGDASPLVANMPSLLSLMGALLPPPKGTRTLSWHYRSRDEELIAFSNAQESLYGWSLTTFPGVSGTSCLGQELVPFQPEVAGQEESSSGEVRRVVELIFEHIALHPDETLGVITMGIKHSDRITEALRRVRPDRPDSEAFFAEERDEPFFIKNLERVQGDERDAIILSIGYGKTVDGRMLYRFGPIAQEGGERRLNVAITRARSRMTLVSSFSSSDMDADRLHSEGPQMLKRYLQYVESGGSDLGSQTRPDVVMNSFERDVFEHLTKAKIPLVVQLGTSGYRLDFAAKHPVNPGRMVLAIEADGAMYHSAYTARDRDRLRQEHLERLGWQFHRIWSTAWFHHREDEVAKAVESYIRAVRIADGEEARNQPPSSPRILGEESATIRTERPRIPRGLSINDYSHRQLVSIVRWIRSDTLFRDDLQLMDEVMADLGFERKGKTIVAAIRSAIATAKDGEGR